MTRRRTLRGAGRPPHASRSSEEECGIFVFPLEIRRQIYTAMTILCRRDHLNFLCTCKRLYSEASESFLSRPLDLADQEQLIRLTTQQSEAALWHTKELSLRLTDIDRERMSPYLAQVVLGTSKMAFGDPYQLETRRITRSLQALPSVRSFSLVDAATPGVPSAPRVVLNNVLSWAAQHYTALTHLRVDSLNVSLEPLASCRSLVSLRITCFSTTPAPQMAVIFKDLTNLLELFIIGPKEQSHYIHCRDAKKSISESFRHLCPLRILSIHDSASTDHSALLTMDMLRAIGETQGQSLKHFCVSSITQLDSAVMFQLAEAVRTMYGVQNLALTWPGIEAEFVSCVPSSTWSLKLLVSDQIHATTLLDALVAIRYRLPRLRKVQFVTQCGVSHICVSPLATGHTVDAKPGVPGGKEAHVPWTMTWSAWEP